MTLQSKTLQRIVGKAVLLLALAAAPLFMSAMGGFSASAYAEDGKQKQSGYAKSKTRRVKALPPNVAKILAKVGKALEADPAQFLAAKAALDSAKSKSARWDGYAQAQYWNLYAYYYYATDNNKGAISAYEKVLTFEDDLPVAFATNTLYQVAQLYYVEENYPQVIKLLLQWIPRVDSVNGQQKVFLGQAYYQTGDMDKSLRWIQEAIADAEAQGDIPEESWWGIEKAIYYEQKDYKAVSRTLEKLVKYYPKAKYWTQLGGVYNELGFDRKSLVAFDVLYIQHLLTNEARLKGLAYLFLGADVPYRAAEILEWGLNNKKIKSSAENLKLLAEAYYTAAETKKAIVNMEKAAKLSDNGELKARLASLYLNADQNQKSATSARAAFAKGNVKRPGNNYMTLGMALVNLKQFDVAIKAFEQALSYERTEQSAKNWLRYAKSEKQRLQSIAASIKG